MSGGGGVVRCPKETPKALGFESWLVIWYLSQLLGLVGLSSGGGRGAETGLTASVAGHRRRKHVP